MYFLLFHPFDSCTEALIPSRNISSYWYLAGRYQTLCNKAIFLS